MTWNDLHAFVAGQNKFLISSHMSPDGDSIGSQLSFYWYLKSLEKEVTICLHDPVPAKFRFLENSDLFTTPPISGHFDVLVILDASNPGRLGWDLSTISFTEMIDIDHHRDNPRFGKINLVETAAAATGEIIFDFFKNLNLKYPKHVADALYTAIISDTGGFRFSNTNSRVLRACADLADQGVDCAKIYERIFATHSQQGLLLQSRIWSTLTYYHDGRVSIMQMPTSLLTETGAQNSDSEGMADYTVTAEGVQVGILIKHSAHETHFSLRSKGVVDVGNIAQKIPGGGGHSNAAGCTINLPYPEALQMMLSIIKQELN
jgi:phosphoesterase RecJ-like protein